MSDKARAMALSMMNIAGQGQTDMGLNQRTGVVDLEGGLSCGKADTSPSLNPPPTSAHKRQR